MTKKMPAQQAAEKLGISSSDLKKIKAQGLIRPTPDSERDALFSSNDIEQIKSRTGLTLAEEANQINIEIQRKMASSVAFTRKIFIFMAGLLSGYVLLLAGITISFIVIPSQTANFFGYYYVSNPDSELSPSILGTSTELEEPTEPEKSTDSESEEPTEPEKSTGAESEIPAKSGSVLQASTELKVEPVETTVLADALKPVAATSLVIVKAVDKQTYKQIVSSSLSTGPSQSPSISGFPGLSGDTGVTGLTGPQGPVGVGGEVGESGVTGSAGSQEPEGSTGDVGVIGLAGPQGPAGTAGADGKDGADGSDGTSVADVMTTSGDVIIRNADNSTTRLAAGSNGQVFTIVSGIPAWRNSTLGSLTFDNLTGGTNLSAAMVVGTGASLNFTNSGTINASSLNGLTFASPGAIGSGTPSTGAFTSLSSSALSSGAGSGLSITSGTSGALTLDSGTTGDVNLGTGSNAKTVAIGNTTGTTAVNINSGTGNLNFTVGPTSSSGKVQVGNSATTTPDLLVLDNGTADPTGVAGGMYYNTTSDRFRCYENSAWKDCDTGLDNVKTSQSNTLASLSTTETSYLSVTITPTSATKNIWITADMNVINNSNNVTITFRIRRGSDCTGTQVGSDVTAGSVKNAILPGTTGVMNFIDSPNTTSATTYQLCALATNSVGATSDGVEGRHITAAEVKLGADLAEAYNSLDTTLEPGEVVAFDAAIDGGAKRSDKAYQNNLLGIVSTNPGMVLSGPSGLGKPILVALSGRVPVKVSTEGGVIRNGDYLTSSSIPGVAMKATKAGTIIGTAITSFDGEGIGKVVVFVKNGTALGNNTEGINTLMQLLGGSVSNSAELPVASRETSDATNSAEPANAGSIIEKNLVKYISQRVSDLFKDTVKFLGKVVFQSDVIFLGRTTFSNDTGGYALIHAGGLEVSVTFDQEYQEPPIIIGRPDTQVIYSISDVGTKGFKIKLDQPEDHDVKFSWTATAIKDAKTFNDSPVAPSPMPSTAIEPTTVESATSSSPSSLIDSTPSLSPVASQSAIP